MKGFEVYVVELLESIDMCVGRNVHNRSREEIEKVGKCIDFTLIMKRV